MLPPVLLLEVSVYLFHLHKPVQGEMAWNHELPMSSFCSKKCVPDDYESADDYFPQYQCSCSESCSTFGDCCYDSPFIDTKAPQRSIEFMCISVARHGRFKAVSSCLPDYYLPSCKKEIGILPPVSSKRTNATYANLYCAICNDDADDFVTWNVELRCSSYLVEDSNDTSNAEPRYEYESGEIWSINEYYFSRTLCMYHVLFGDSRFMKGLELRKCTESERISECPASWEDSSVLEMCSAYEDPVYFHDTEYRNAHCAFCNYQNLKFLECVPFSVKVTAKMHLDDHRLREFCESRVCKRTDPESESNVARGKDYAFSELFAIYGRGCFPPRGRRCCVGEAFDKRSGKCRKVQRSKSQEL